MINLELFARPSLLVGICAGSYAGATIAMKMASHLPNLTSGILIAIFLLAAVITEILLMQRFDIGVTYIAILAGETMLVILAAYAIGEGLSPVQIFGGLLVLFGAALVTA